MASFKERSREFTGIWQLNVAVFRFIDVYAAPVLLFRGEKWLITHARYKPLAHFTHCVGHMSGLQNAARLALLVVLESFATRGRFERAFS